MYTAFLITSPTITNCIFWGNSDNGGMDESAQIHKSTGTPVVNYSDIQGLGAGGFFDSGANTNNIGDDPLFVDADGADNTVGTVDDDLHLQSVSPCIDVGDNSVWVFPPPPFDLDGNLRIVGCTIDMGAYEFQTCNQFFHPADFDCDGDVDGIDFSFFASAFNKAGNPPRPASLP